MTWPFDPLQPLSFDLIMVDPPWTFDNWSKAGEKKNAKAKYDCMTLDEIKAMPVSQLARGDCLLWLWATNPMLPQAIDTMKAWGFKYVTAGTWVKQTVKGSRAFGTGYVLRSENEPYLIGAHGNPRTAKNIRSCVFGPVREHSRKPEEAYEAAEKLAISATRRADVFSRTTRPGWEAWGNEAGKFDEAAA